MRMHALRRGGLVGLAVATILVTGALPASAATGDGSAFGADVNVELLGIDVEAGRFAEAHTDGPTDDSFADLNVPSVVSAKLLEVSAHLDDPTGRVDSQATATDAVIGVLGPTNPIEATLIEATCTATQEGNVGSSKLLGVKGGTLADGDVSAAPNTEIDVDGIATIILNEQINNPDGSLTVNAIHIVLLSELKSIGSGDLIVSSATCGPAGPPIPMASGAGLWISLGLIAMAVLPAAVVISRRRAQRSVAA
jgi:hypothetical protein